MQFSCGGAALVAAAVLGAAIYLATEIAGSGSPPPPKVDRLSTGTIRATVSARQDWQASGVHVDPGDDVEISAVGEWYPFGNGYRVGPDGCTDRNVCSQELNQSANICCMAHAGLIGKIGDGAPFKVGARLALRNVLTRGELYLRINDKNLSDNDGGINVTIAETVK
ncbi:hypothetical protein ABT213_20565 [Streptomyces sp. NPDC001674]|uniref:hypothetical protein n=1 Tax=Streptomyces sp. NPDC001674 TaxID=3154394 RepID=UPI003322FCF0